jgi:hypothetical protein
MGSDRLADALKSDKAGYVGIPERAANGGEPAGQAMDDQRERES